MPIRPSLNDLGPRICIMGPSNSGKSTLAKAIGNARGLLPIHLDQLRHIPKTDWKLRPIDELSLYMTGKLRGRNGLLKEITLVVCPND